MNLGFLSDTHGYLPVIDTEFDILFHCGDICPDFNKNAEHQADWFKNEFVPWLNKVPAKHKVLIGGNHDFVLQHYPKIINFLPSDCYYLQDSAVELEGYKIYGSPWTPYYYNWAFNSKKSLLGTEEDLIEKYRNIPLDTDILITHGPPMGILDQTIKNRCGSKALLERIECLRQLKFHAFGHIHEAHGSFEKEKRLFINCSLSDFNNNIVNKITQINIGTPAL